MRMKLHLVYIVKNTNILVVIALVHKLLQLRIQEEAPAIRMVIQANHQVFLHILLCMYGDELHNLIYLALALP